MTRQQFLRKYDSLSASARRQVDAFVASLAMGDQRKVDRRRRKVTSIADEPFIGMWRDRVDMTDSAAWVRSLRRRSIRRPDKR